MASGHAKLTGEVGVCLATSGPGAIHLLNGLYDAKLDKKPVVAIVGQSARAAMGGHFQQEVDLLSLFKDVAGDFVQVCTTPQQARHLIDRAFRIAKAERTVTAVIFPNDIQEMAAAEPGHAHATIHSGADFREPVVLPEEADLIRAAEILNKGERVAMLIGAGAWNAADEVIATAETLQAGVAKALLGKAVLPDDLPFSTGQIGLLGTKAVLEADERMRHAADDRLDLSLFGIPAQGRPGQGGADRYRSHHAVAALSHGCGADRRCRRDAEGAAAASEPEAARALARKRSRRTSRPCGRRWSSGRISPPTPLNPELFFWEFSSRIPDDAIVAADTGMSATFFARAVKMRRGMKTAISGTLATMGPAVSYALAAKFAFPDRPAFAFVGDGAMQMLGMNGLITAAKYWKRWADPRLIIAVLEQSRSQYGELGTARAGRQPKVAETQDLPDLDYAAHAELLGLKGLTVRGPGDVGARVGRGAGGGPAGGD